MTYPAALALADRYGLQHGDKMKTSIATIAATILLAACGGGGGGGGGSSAPPPDEQLEAFARDFAIAYAASIAVFESGLVPVLADDARQLGVAVRVPCGNDSGYAERQPSGSTAFVDCQLTPMGQDRIGGLFTGSYDGGGASSISMTRVKASSGDWPELGPYSMSGRIDASVFEPSESEWRARFGGSAPTPNRLTVQFPAEPLTVDFLTPNQPQSCIFQIGPFNETQRYGFSCTDLRVNGLRFSTSMRDFEGGRGDGLIRIYRGPDRDQFDTVDFLIRGNQIQVSEFAFEGFEGTLRFDEPPLSTALSRFQ